MARSNALEIKLTFWIMMHVQDKRTARGLCSLVFMLFMAVPWAAHATHLVGGEMYYDYIGNDQYEVHLVIYRDCGPTNTNGTDFDLAASIAVYEGADLYYQGSVSLNNSDVSFVDLQSGNPCAQLPAGVCVERAVYNTVITLPQSPETYTICLLYTSPSPRDS